MTYWKLVSFDRRLSERKNPSSSEESLDRRQNCWSVSSTGSDAATARPDEANRTVLITPRIRHPAKKIRQCRLKGRFCGLMGAILARINITSITHRDDIARRVDIGRSVRIDSSAKQGPSNNLWMVGVKKGDLACAHLELCSVCFLSLPLPKATGAR